MEARELTEGRRTTARRRLIADRVARWLVTAGGMAIIASILGILVFILIEVWPLFSGAAVTPGPRTALPGATGGAVVVDEHRSRAAVLSSDGRIRVYDIASGRPLLERGLFEDPTALRSVQGAPGSPVLTGSTADGRVGAVEIRWRVTFEGSRRVVEPEISTTHTFLLDPDGGALGAFGVRIDADGAAAAAAQLEDGSLALTVRELDENPMTGEVTESSRSFRTTAPAGLTGLVVASDLRTVYGGTASGEVAWWRLRGEALERGPAERIESPAVTAVSQLLGGRSLLVGRTDGSLAVWFLVRDHNDDHVLRRIREFPSLAAPVRIITPSMRDKSFLAADDAGGLGLYHSTSHARLWLGRSPLPEATGAFYSPKADAAYLIGGDALAAVEIDNPHPEISIKALFGKVWYEGYEEPRYVWQSSSGTDDFEPKLSLTPLMVGTIKGTIYSLFLAIPLGVFGAMFTSQFMHPDLKALVKPVVEIMASLPSVVLGFLAGLWLAPRVEKIFPGLILMVILLPLLVLLAHALLEALPRTVRSRLAWGAEVFPYMIVLALGIWISVRLSPGFESLFFGGSFQDWLLGATGLRYDQRNAIVVGLAMGFAVIPVIFAIAEDAFSNVPRNLVSGSLALGANRWQTVIRVVLPSASPGIFSGIMVGFGRAVGETMIVLMATGNTPILDWNPFNGFRTLSANIAVEIPEAPHGATLYRTLFLAALILFAFTFLINTLAEVVRQRLRQRYSQL